MTRAISPASKTPIFDNIAPMQDHQGSEVAVSHQKYDIFNSDRFPHACCGTVMLPWRRQRPQRSIYSPSSEARKRRPGRGLGEVAVHMIPSPIHFLAYARPFRPGVEPREPAVRWNYNSCSAYVFGRGGRRRFLPEQNCRKKPVSSLKPRAWPMCTQGGLGFGLVRN